MCEEDQSDRSEYMQKMLNAMEAKDSIALISLKRYHAEVIQKVDKKNYDKLLSIIETYGFPLSNNNKFGRWERGHIYVALQAMMLHFTDSAQVMVLQPLLLHYIEIGECPPEFLSGLIDKSKSENGTPYIYGFYSNVRKEQIFEYDKVDERRAAIGLPTLSITQEINNIKRQL
jgi:hypothetical protein